MCYRGSDIVNWSLTAHRRAEAFEAEFIDEHLEEIGFLLEHRLALLRGATPNWTDVAPFDARLFTHLRAFEAYDRRARAQALARLQAEALADSPDDNMISGAAYALGASSDEPALAKQVISLAAASAEVSMPAWKRGLRMAQGHALDFAMHDALDSAPAATMRTFLATLGWRRRLRPDVVLRAFGTWPLKVQEAAAWALAKVGYTPAAPLLHDALSRHPGSVAIAAALLSIGDNSVLSHVRALASESVPEKGSLRLLALGGNVRDADMLVRAPHSLEAVTAMGILGSFSLVPELLRHLSVSAGEPPLCAAAAAALERMSQAGLRETVELTDDSEDKFEPGGSPSSRVMERVSQDPEHWMAFFGQHQGQFVPGKRYRRGAEFRVESCIDEIADPASPFSWRHDAADEWRLRTKHVTDFEPEAVINSQHQSLQSMRRAL